jgi:glutaredoxin 2
LKLYIDEHCPFCSRARLALGLKNLPFEIIVVMEDDAETPTRLVGKKAVPIIGDAKLWPILRSLSIVDGLQFPPAVRSDMERLAVDGEMPLLFDQAR